MSDPAERPRRFIIIPPPGPDDSLPTPTQTLRQMRRAAVRHASQAQAEVQALPAGSAAPGLKVVNRSPADGALLVEPVDGAASIAEVEARAPAGAQVYEEQWYRLDRPTHPWRRAGRELARPRPQAAGGSVVSWPVLVSLDASPRQRLGDVRVTLMIDEAQGVGVEGVTDRFGRVSFELPDGTQRLDAAYADPLHGGWPLALTGVERPEGPLELLVPPLDPAAADVRTRVHGEAPARAGEGVAVGVVDTGVGPHAALEVVGGRNTTEESPRRIRDEQGHGTHVAGVIAARAAGVRRGEAPAVALYAYRIFQADDDYASSFAISAAIKQAALDGCDLINLSIGGGGADGSVRDAIDFAWERGCVCLAATGNDGAGQVDYPARYPRSVAVSAIGLEGSWPAGTYFDWTLSRSRGKALDGGETYFASFSNRGAKVLLTSPGVAVVSTLPGDRYGVMSGTSMATPIATGVLARRLAGSPIRELPRDAARAAAIVQLAVEHAEDLGLAAPLQGRGLAR